MRSIMRLFHLQTLNCGWKAFYCGSTGVPCEELAAGTAASTDASAADTAATTTLLATSVIKPHPIDRKALTVAKRIDLFDSTYSHFTKQVLETIRKETFGQDIGQNSWTTVEEYDRFISWLDLRPGHHVLEVASGSGGPARYLADSVNCRVTGIDANEAGVATATLSVANSSQ